MPPTVEEQIASDRDRWNQLLADHYSTAPPDPEARFDVVFEEQPSRFLEQQIATHLEALSFLEIDETAPSIDQAKLDTALREWDAARRSAEGEVEVSLEDEDLAKLSARERAIRLLKAHCTFEGETTVRGWRTSGPESLATRIAAHRLHVFGFLGRGQAAVACDAAALGIVETQLQGTGSNSSDIVNLLGDVPELTSRFVMSQAGQVFALAPEFDRAAAVAAEFSIRRGSRAGLRRSSFRSAASNKRRGRTRRKRTAATPQPPTPGKLLHPGLTREPPSASAPPPAPRELLRFAARLLQVRLWMFGYYTGEIDGQWGPMFAGALRRFAEEHAAGAENEDGLAAPEKWLRDVDGACVVDLCYLFSYMLERLDEAAEVTARDDIDKLLNESLGVDSTPADDANLAESEAAFTRDLLDAHARRRQAESHDRSSADAIRAPGTVKHRRRYFGWRAVFGLVGRAIRWIGRTIRNAFEWLRAKIKKLLHYATTLLNYLREKTRRVVRLVSLGFQRIYHWLTGKPVATVRGGSFVATRWNLDFDTVNVMQGAPTRSLAVAHATRLEAMHAGFGFLVEVALSVWNLIKAAAAPFVNWILLAWRAFKAVRAILAAAEEYAGLLDRLEPAVV